MPLETFEIDAEIANTSDAPITASSEHPLRLSYHWIDPTSGTKIVYGGLRTEIAQTLLPGSRARYGMRVQAPPDPTDAVLRVTLVQEHRFWFDAIAPDSAANLAFRIRRSPAWAEDDAAHAYHARTELNDAAFAPHIRHGGRSRPLMLIVETTNICNNHCIICAYDSQSRRKQRMPLDVFSETVRQYVEMGGGALSLTPMVGDVFMDKLLRERLAIIAWHRPKGITRLSVVTNAGYAKLYDDTDLADILGHFDDLAISIYGIDEEEFEIMTQTTGYDLMRTGIDRIFRLSRARISLNFRCLKERKPDELRDWAAALPSYDLARDRVKIMPNVRRFANWGVLDTTKPLPFGATWMPPTNSEKAQCGVPLLALQVFSNGNVSYCPCDDFDNHDSLHLGNVMTETLAEMFNGVKGRRLWNWAEHGTPAFCRSCSFHQPLERLIKIPNVFQDPLVVVGG